MCLSEKNYSPNGLYRPVTEVRVPAVVVVTYVRLDHQNRESTQIYANREPIHPCLTPLIAGHGRLAKS